MFSARFALYSLGMNDNNAALDVTERLLERRKADVERALEHLTRRRAELTMAEEAVETAEAELQVYNDAVQDAMTRRNEILKAQS